MTHWRFLLGFTLILAYSCISGNDCENSDINSFNTFLGISNETTELELSALLGDATGGYYSEDNKNFIYDYRKLADSPVSVAVNATTSTVETVFMEVLTVGVDFDNDLQIAIDHYKISDCDARFFGLTRTEIIDEMGEPMFEATDDKGVQTLEYNSSNFKTSVIFKCYPEQAFRCSSIIVSWI